MATQEIDELELMRLRKQDQTVHALMNDPVSKKKIFEAYKTKFPDARIPELEIEEAARAETAGIRKEMDDLKQQLANEKAEREKAEKLAALNGSVESGKAKLRQQGWTDDGIAAVEKVMEEKGILDVEVAAAFYEKQHPQQAPAAPSGVGAWNFVEQVPDTDGELKKLLETRGDNELVADKMARDALNEFRGNVRR